MCIGFGCVVTRCRRVAEEEKGEVCPRLEMSRSMTFGV